MRYSYAFFSDHFPGDRLLAEVFDIHILYERNSYPGNDGAMMVIFGIVTFTFYLSKYFEISLNFSLE